MTVARLANARMYAVTPEVEEAWEALLTAIGRLAGVPLAYHRHRAPAPLDDLWSRDDLGLAFMCGYPLAKGLFPGEPLAAPIPAAAWSQGRPAYRSHLVVAAGSRFATLADTFGGTVGWTVTHSHSGYSALRHHLLAFRSEGRDRLYTRSVGPLVTPLAVVAAVLDGRIDIGPVDSACHDLLLHHRPDLTAGLRVVDATALAPMPPLVASPSTPAPDREALRAALVAASAEPWFAALADVLRIRGFSPVTRADYAVTLERETVALAAGYPEPA